MTNRFFDHLHKCDWKSEGTEAIHSMAQSLSTPFHISNPGALYSTRQICQSCPTRTVQPVKDIRPEPRHLLQKLASTYRTFALHQEHQIRLRIRNGFLNNAPTSTDTMAFQ